MTYLVVLSPGEEWWPDRPTLDQGQPIEQHRVAMRRLQDDGLLLAGGMLVGSGAVALFNTSDSALVRSLVAADPAVVRRVLRPRFFEVTDYRGAPARDA
jgi:hypothetical protein